MAKRVNIRFVSIVGGIFAAMGVGVVAGPGVARRLFQKPVPEQVKALVAEAQADVRDGKIAEAKDAIIQASRLDSNNKELCVQRGDILMLFTREEGHVATEQARASWENALQIDPTYKPALQRLLDSYIEQLEVRPTPEVCIRLRDTAMRSVKLDPSDAKAQSYVYIATIQQWVQGLPTAKELINQSLQSLTDLQAKNPTSAEILMYLVRGKTFGAIQDYQSGHAEAADATIKDCRKLLESAVAAYPKEGVINFRVFQGYMGLLDAGRSAQLARKDQALAARDVDQMLKDRTAADAALVTALTQIKPEDPHFEDVQYVAQDWDRRNGRLDDAEKVMRNFYALRKNDQRVRLELCRVLAQTGDSAKRAEAIAILKLPVVNTGVTGAKQLGTRELVAQTLLDLAGLRISEFYNQDPSKRPALLDEIEDYYKKLESMAVADSIPVLRLHGMIAELKGDNVEAVNALSRAMTLLEHSDPNNAVKYDLMNQLATACHLAQQNRSAEKWFIQLVNRFDGYSPARMQLADLYLEENNLAEAEKHIDILVKQKPDSPEVMRLQIALAQRSGKTKEALALIAKLPEVKFEDKLGKAQYFANLQAYREAVDMLLKMKAERPDDIGIIAALYQGYGKLTPVAREDQKKLLADALKQHPNEPRLLLLDQQDKNASPEAISQLMDRLIIQTGEPFYVKIREARRQYAAGNFSEALARTQEADQIRRNDPATWDLFFSIYVLQQKWDMAERAVDNLGRMNADQSDGRMYRWKLEMARGRYADAITVGHDLTVARDNFGQSWILLAQAHQANGQYNEAIKEYQAALERQTTNIDAYRGMADCYDQLSQPERGLEIVSQGFHLFPESIYLRERMLGYLIKINPVAVVAERQKLLDANPADPENYIAMASACVEAAQKILPVNPEQAKAFTDQARQVLSKGVGKFPDNLRLNGALADALQNSAQFDAGVKILQDLGNLPAWKDRPDPQRMIGEYYARRHKGDDLQKAEAAFRAAWAKTNNKDIDIQLRIVAFLEDEKKYDECLKVLTVNASEPRVQRQILQVHIAANHTEEARKGLLEALDKSPNDVPMLDLLAVVDIDGGNFAEARTVIGKSLHIDPRNDITLYYQALAELRDPAGGDLQLALHNLSEAVFRNPRNTQFRLEAAGAEIRAHDMDGAVSDLEGALQYEPFNFDVRARLLDLYSMTKKWAQFEQVVTYAEQNPIISRAEWFRAHAFALAAQQKFPQAIQKIREAIAIDGQNPSYARDYLAILLQAKDNSSVIQETDRLMNSGHNEWWVHHLRALALHEAGKKSEAIEQLDKAIAVADASTDGEAFRQSLASMADMSLDEAILRLAPRIATSDYLRVQSATLYARKLDWAKALEQIDPLLQKRDKLPRPIRLAAIRLTAECYQYSGKPQESKKYYMEWLKESPNDLAVLNNLACLMAEDLHDAPGAKQYSQRAYDAGRKLNYVEPFIIDTHGWVLTLCPSNAEQNAGLALLSSLVDGHGDFLEARYHLGKAYLINKRPADAVVQLKAATELVKSNEAKGVNVQAQLKDNIQKSLAEAEQASASTR